jgi:seryl-tRNA synthetase
MIDLKAYRADKQKYIDGAKNKRVVVDREQIDHLDATTKDLKQQLDDLAARRNQLSAQVQEKQKSGGDFSALITEVKTIKEQFATIESTYNEQFAVFEKLLATIPNPPMPEVIVGKDDTENQVAAYIGTKKEFSFAPKPHWELLEAKGYLDSERAVKISGSRFVMLKGKGAQLEFAMMQRAIEKLSNKWFIFTIVPQLVREQAMWTTGFLPNEASNLYRVNPKRSAEKSEISEKIENMHIANSSEDSKNLREEDDLWLIGTSEVPLVSQHIDEVLDADQLPLRYFGFSSCYRREAWTYGKDAKWLIRVHQFEKIEMVSFVKPEDSIKEHEFFRTIEEEIFIELWLHFQRLHICTGDLGAPAAKKYDLEAWFPGIGVYKEVTSTSNTTDFQTRRGNIKFKDGDRREYLHSLNGTALALGRALASLVETYQTEEGDIVIPEVLRKWMGVEKI